MMSLDEGVLLDFEESVDDDDDDESTVVWAQDDFDGESVVNESGKVLP